MYIVHSIVLISLMFVTTHDSANLKLYIWYTSLSIKSPDEGDAVRCWHKFIQKQNIDTTLVKIWTFIWKEKMLPYKILVTQIIWWLYQCTAFPLYISTNGYYLSDLSAAIAKMQQLLHYSRCSPSAWIYCLNFQNRLRLTHCSYFYLPLFFLVLYACTYTGCPTS